MKKETVEPVLNGKELCNIVNKTFGKPPKAKLIFTWGNLKPDRKYLNKLFKKSRAAVI